MKLIDPEAKMKNMLKGTKGVTRRFAGIAVMEIIPDSLRTSGKVEICTARVMEIIETIAVGRVLPIFVLFIFSCIGDTRKIIPSVADSPIWKEGSYAMSLGLWTSIKDEATKRDVRDVFFL